MRPALFIITFLAVLAGVMLVVNSPAPSSLAQTDAPIAQEQSAPPAPDPPGTIDGAKNPELIPDDVAYRLVFIGIAEPENATEEQKARARAKIGTAGLSEQDAEVFLYLLSQFQTQLDTLTAQMVEIHKRSPILHPLSTDAEQMRELLQQTQQLYANTIAALPAKLSLEGAVKMRAYVQQEKRNMKIIPDTTANMMPTN